MDSPVPTAAHGFDPFGDTNYLLKRAMFSIGGKLHIYSSTGMQVLFARQKAFKLREDIRIFSDETMATEIMTIKARQIIDWSAAYDVVDSRSGEKVGALRRKGWKSIIRDTWQVMNAEDQLLGEITEDNMIASILRRLEYISLIVPQGYDLKFGDTKVADYHQNFNPFTYHLNVDFTMDRGRLLDRRLGIAAAILLAVIEGRQRR